MDHSTRLKPRAQDAGLCGDTKAQGLILFESIDGEDKDTYCKCDVGNCQFKPKEVDVEVGTKKMVFSFDGRNFHGPSDTSIKPGLSFKKGVATIKVSAEVVDSSGTRREAIATKKINLF